MRKHQIKSKSKSKGRYDLTSATLVGMHWWCMSYARRILNAATPIEKVMLVENARKLQPHWTRKIDLYLAAAQSAALHRYHRN